MCAGAKSRVSFLDLFGPIAGVTNPIMLSLSRRNETNPSNSLFQMNSAWNACHKGLFQLENETRNPIEEPGA